MRVAVAADPVSSVTFAGFILVLTPMKFVRLNRLKVSNRTCPLSLPLSGKFLYNARSTWKKPGPWQTPRGEFPNVPSWKPVRVNLSGFSHCSGGPPDARQDCPSTTFGRWLLFRPVPETRFDSPGMEPVNTVSAEPDEACAMVLTSQPPSTCFSNAERFP